MKSHPKRKGASISSRPFFLLPAFRRHSGAQRRTPALSFALALRFPSTPPKSVILTLSLAEWGSVVEGPATLSNPASPLDPFNHNPFCHSVGICFSLCTRNTLHQHPNSEGPGFNRATKRHQNKGVDFSSRPFWLQSIPASTSGIRSIDIQYLSR